MTRIDVAGFLAWRFPDLGPDERIEVRAFPVDGGRRRQSWHADPRDAARAALALADTHDVYYGVNARVEGGGKKEHVTAVRGLWADQDFGKYADGRVGADKALAAFPLRPSAIVGSGGGYHLYWQFAEPVVFEGPDDPARVVVEETNVRLYVALGGLDAVQDLPRILRVPGTFNHKEAHPRLVTIEREDRALTYDLADFDDVLPRPVPAVRPDWQPPSGAARGFSRGDLTYDDVRELLRYVPPQRTYKEWQTTLAAVASIFPGADGVALCEEWSPGDKHNPIAEKFASFKRDPSATNAASAGTLIHIARQYGWQPPRPTIDRSIPVPSPTFPTAADADAGQDVLQMARTIAAQREEIERLTGALTRCQEAHKRKDATIAAQDTRIAALEAALTYPDSTMGGAAFDFAQAAFESRDRGDSLLEDGIERHQVCFRTAARWRSSTTLGNAKRKYKEHGVIDVTERTVQVKTPDWEGDADVAYVAIPPECDTAERFVLHLLSKPIEKQHGGARRRKEMPPAVVEQPDPVKRVRKLTEEYRSLVDDKKLATTVTVLGEDFWTHEGEQLTREEAEAFAVKIGAQPPPPPKYRPVRQMPLSAADADLFERPSALDDLDDISVPIPLHGPRCRVPGCGRAPVAEGFCSNHAAVVAFAAGDD